MKSLLMMLFASSLLYSEPTENFHLTAPNLTQSLDPLQIPPPAPAFEQPYKSPFLAATLSIIPGLGHVYLGDMQTAGGLFGSASLAANGLVFGRTEALQTSSLFALNMTCCYSFYAAYRDARAYNKGVSYSYQMPTDSFADLSLAPFRWSVIKKPEVWGGFLGALTAALGIAYLSANESHASVELSTEGKIFPFMALPVGIAEESLFRGYLQSQLSESWNPVAGITLSSLAFGAAHIGNAAGMDRADQRRYYAVSIPFITAFGAYFGWMTYKNHSLKESVALHTWYDFVLFAGSAWASRAAIRGPTEFSMAIPF